MLNDQYRISEDLLLVRQLLEKSQTAIADAIGITDMTVSNWETSQTRPTEAGMEKLYSFIWDQGIRINEVKSLLYMEENANSKNKMLFHGAKKSISGELSLNKSKKSNDFGSGFYCGEALEQAETFIADYGQSCVYIFQCNIQDLCIERFPVSREWMLAITYYRKHPALQMRSSVFSDIIARIEKADIIIAPIADNQMYKLLDRFADGELTDIQCQHMIAATDLGFQYVFKTQKALDSLKCLERCYVCSPEKEHYKQRRQNDRSIADSKVRAAQIKYRRIGNYIDELI